MTRPRLLPAGECALVAEFGRTADPAFHALVLGLDAALAASPVPGILERVPTYRSLMIHFDPRVVTMAELARILGAIDIDAAEPAPAHRWVLPVCYEQPHAEDLEEAAALLSLSPEDVVRAHSGAAYRVVMYGFAPGFAFMSGLPERLRLPRRGTPRAPAPAGALTIANGQALIASVAMPTGWYMLGRTPARLFRPDADPMFPLAVGDSVTLARVDAATFDALAGRAEAGEPILERAG